MSPTRGATMISRAPARTAPGRAGRDGARTGAPEGRGMEGTAR